MSPERIASLRLQAERALGPECGERYRDWLYKGDDGFYWRTCRRSAGHEGVHGQGRPIGVTLRPEELLELLDALTTEQP